MDFDDVVLLLSYLHLLAPSLKVCCSCLYADGASFSQLCDFCSFPLKARRHTDFFSSSYFIQMHKNDSYCKQTYFYYSIIFNNHGC